MKRFYALLLSVIMIVTLSLTALANQNNVHTSYCKLGVGGECSPSCSFKPTPGGGGGGGGGGAAATWTPPAVTAVSIEVAGAKVTGLGDTFAKSVDALMDNRDGFLDTYNIPASAKVAAFFDLKFDGDIPAGGLNIPIEVKNADPGDYVIVLHRKADGIWEVVARGFLGADLTIVATFTSFSPVLVLVVDAADVAVAGIRAPKTGE